MSFSFKITEQVKKDFQTNIDFWKAASESNDLRFCKENWDRYKLIMHIDYGCAFCHYFKKCYLCPFGEKLGKCHSKYMLNSYDNWSHADCISDKQTSAKQIYDFCLSWANENIFNQENVE
jgi:hypothetical protein